MTTLITGGGSKVGTSLAKLLKGANRNVLFASRSGGVPDGFESVHFDWFDPSTFENAFAKDSQIQSVYLLPPTEAMKCLHIVKPFIDLAVRKGVERFILLSASDLSKGPDAVGPGAVHDYLESKGLSYLGSWADLVYRSVLSFPSFPRYAHTYLVALDNLVWYKTSIQDENQFVTANPKGRIPFVAVDDIAQAAFNGIVNSGPEQQVGGVVLIGPDLLSYNDVATVLSDVLGRKITHKVITPAEKLEGWIALGLPQDYATLLIQLETAIEDGAEERLLDDPRKIVGKISVREWIEKNKNVFMKV